MVDDNVLLGYNKEVTGLFRSVVGKSLVDNLRDKRGKLRRLEGDIQRAQDVGYL